jgi:hypothetical protein
MHLAVNGSGDVLSMVATLSEVGAPATLLASMTGGQRLLCRSALCCTISGISDFLTPLTPGAPSAGSAVS